ncbi:MAG: MMPL family transporter [Acidimicrobiales bacterium]
MAEPEHMTRMQRFWSWLAVYLGKHAGIVAVVGLLVTLILGYGTTKLSFATGQDSYLNPEDKVAIDNVAYQNLFGGQAMLALLTADQGKTVNDIMTSANQATFDKIAEELRANPDVIEGVITPKEALVWSDRLVQSPDGNPTNSIAGKALLAALNNDPSPEGKAARTADTAKTLERLNAIPADQRNLTNPVWVDFLIHDNQGEIRKPLRAVFTDDTHAQIVVRLKGNASIETEGKGADLVTQVMQSNDLANATTTVTGAPVLLKEINDYLKGGMLQLGAIAIVVMCIILLLLFDVRWRLLPLAVILVGVTWAFGLAGYLGIPLSLVTIAGLPVMLGIGIDYAIQMHARVEEEVVIDRAAHPIQETARNLCPALLVVTFDAVFAFAALRWAQVPMIRMFGLLLAVGIAVICFASIIVPLATLGIREYKSPTKGRDFREGFLGRLTVKLGSLPIWLGPVLAVASLAVFFGGIAVEEKLTLQTDVAKWVNQSSEGIKNFRSVEAQTGSSSELGIYVVDSNPNDVFSQRVVDFMHEFSGRNLQKYPEDLLTATSLVDTVGDLTSVPGASDVTPQAADVKAAFDAAPVDIQKSTVNPQAGAMNLIFRYGQKDLESRLPVVREIDSSTKAGGATPAPDGVEATPSGLAVVGVGLLENLNANRVALTYLSILFVGLFLAVRLRSVVRSLLSLVPVLIAVGAASLVAWALGLKLSPMTAVGGPLVVAACTEFTSLILLRFLEERRRGLPPRPAVDVAASRTGRAFIVSGLTAISGVAVIATSSLPLLRDFGIIVGMNVAVALFTALTVLPPLLVWADDHGWVSRHMIPEDVLLASTPGLRRRKGLPPIGEGAPEGGDEVGATAGVGAEPVASGSSAASDAGPGSGNEPPAEPPPTRPLFS